jgi:hypothetical protein
LIGSFIFDDDFRQIAVEYFAIAAGGGGVHHGGVYEGIVPIVLHADGNAGNLKNICIAKQRAMPGFTDAETDFGEPHDKLLK